VLKVIADEISTADPAVSVDPTGYFNHSYRPDFIARWGSGSAEETRPYYVRMSLDRDELREDMQRLSDLGAAFVDLFPRSGETESDPVVEAATASGTLVASAQALEELAEVSSEEGFARLIPPAIVRNGKGLIDVAQAEDLGGAARSALDAAARVDEDDTRDALNTIGRFVTNDQAVELERTIAVVWLAAGGEEADFPRTIDLEPSSGSGGLAATLRILFDQPLVDIDEFWERVAGIISEDDLLALGEVEDNQNLQRLMRYAVDRLRFVSVGLGQPSANPSGVPGWTVAGGGLILSTALGSLHFVRDGHKHAQWPGDREVAPWSQLLGRLGQYGIERVEFESETASVTFEVKNGGVGSTDLAQQMAALGNNGSVRELIVRVESGDTVRIRLPKGVALSNKSKQIPMGPLGLAALQVMGPDAAPDLIEQVRQALGMSGSEG
jgi:hypothetical protein